MRIVNKIRSLRLAVAIRLASDLDAGLANVIAVNLLHIEVVIMNHLLLVVGLDVTFLARVLLAGLSLLLADPVLV
jgi:hypothetical protein